MNRSLELKRFLKKLGCTAIVALFLTVCLNMDLRAAPIVGAPVYYDFEETLGGDIHNFEWFRNGLILDTNRTFASPCPIENSDGTAYLYGIDLAGRLLVANSDLYLGNGTKIVGDGVAAEIKSSNGSEALIMNGDVQLQGGNVLIGGITINGGGNILDFNNFALEIKTAATLTIKNAVLKNVTAGSFIWQVDSILALENVVIELSGNLALGVATGTITVAGNVLVTGADTFSLSNGTISIATDAILSFDHGTAFNYTLGTFTNAGTLHLNGCSVSLGGDLAVAGTVLFENKVVVSGTNTFDLSGAATKVLSGARVELQGTAKLDVG